MPRYHDAPPTAEDVRFAYRLLLGRAAESEAAVAGHLRQPTLRHLLRAFIGSREFRSAVGEDLPLSEQDRLMALIERLGVPLPDSGDPACWTDLLGVRHRTQYRSDLLRLGGRHVPGPTGEPLEWLALLEALDAGGESFVAMELGAGYGPWLSRAGVGWRRLRPGAPLRLIGVEGEPTHFAWLRQHLAENGLAGPGVELHEAAVASAAGRVEFPLAEDPAADWGTCPHAGATKGGRPTRSVPALTLGGLLARERRVDLLHVDIQGGELAVLTAAGRELARVGRLCVGTHGRDLEAGLMALLPPLGFRLEAEEACSYRCPTDRPVLTRDGTQYWINRQPA
jgi:FkbM family methyltransferase